MQKTQSDVSIDAIAFGFQSCFGEMASISFCLESAIASGFRYSIAEMASISSRGGHVRAFTYNYVKTRPEYPAPHDLSASQSEAARSECVVLESAKCGFQFGIGEMAGISSRGGHVRALTYDYVKTYLEHPAPHDLSARLISQAQTSSFNFTNFTNLMTIASVLSKTSPALGSSSFITDATGYAVQHLQYLPFGETFVDQQFGYDSRYTFSAKEKDDETQYSYFGARYYDSDLSVWLSVDPMADNTPYQTPYMYCSGNPVMRIDPDGNDDFTIDKESGDVKLVKKTDDKTDRVVKTYASGKRKGEVKYNRKGEAKTAFGGVEKGILSDGSNFQENDNIIEVGGEGQATVDGVKSFTLQLSEYVGREIKGFSYSSNSSKDVTHMLLCNYKKNDLRKSYGSHVALQEKFGADFSFSNILQIFHTHPMGQLGATKYAPERSGDVEALQIDKPFVPNAHFIVLYRVAFQKKPGEYDYTKEYKPKK
jgi:RHS repeat-associated protein